MIPEDYAAHLRGICDVPADDLRRLVLADRLQDDGDPERAEFVRVQVELAKPRIVVGAGMWPGLKDRERELFVTLESRGRLFEFGTLFCGELIGPCGADVYGIATRGFVSEVRLSLAAFLGGPCVRCAATGYIRVFGGRGGISHPGRCDRCYDGDTMGMAAALFAGHPITRVVLLDREPVHGINRAHGSTTGEEWMWSPYMLGERSPYRASYIPPALFGKFPKLLDPTVGKIASTGHYQFWTRTAADKCLSDAAVAFARELAGLSPLVTP